MRVKSQVVPLNAYTKVVYITINQRVLKTKCNTFTPQIQGIPENTFAMYASTRGDI